MFSYFENRKTTYFDVFCLNFSIETKIKTLFLISYFNLSKKRNGTLGTQIVVLSIFTETLEQFVVFVSETDISCYIFHNISCTKLILIHEKVPDSITRH